MPSQRPTASWVRQRARGRRLIVALCPALPLFILQLLLLPASYQAAGQHLSPGAMFLRQPLTRPSTLADRKQYPTLATRTSAPSQQHSQLLVNEQQTPSSDRHHHMPVQSLPLLMGAELDNVIESTTANLLLDVAAQRAPISTCQLPPTWAGKWYQSNKAPIRVTNTEISDKGVCRDQKGDKYLFEFTGATNARFNQQQPQTNAPCLVCLVINERHLNVLQYKESSCQPIPSKYFKNSTNNQLSFDNDHSLLDSICSDITGDAQLESLFRLDTPPIECPIGGQFSFTYDACREPQSSLDSCIDKKQLNFKFAACPDVPGSESKSEVLKCYADWTEGNNYYMIGRIEHASNHHDKGKFRCFLYEKSLDGKIIQMAQSLEESCSGLINSNEGPKTLRLTVKPPTAQKCHFPTYIQTLSENWLSVDNSLIYMFNQNSTKYTVKETREGNIIEEASCLRQFILPRNTVQAHHQYTNQIRYRTENNAIQAQTNRRNPSTSSSIHDQADQPLKNASNDLVYLVQIVKNCHITNYCVRFYQRSNGIVQIDYFISTLDGDGQCQNVFTGTPQTQIITSTNQEYQRCPFEGAYTIEAPIESDLTYNPSNIFVCPRQSFLTAQCDDPTRLRIYSKCSPTKYAIKNLHCLGSWTTNGLVRSILIDDDRQKYSAWYIDYGDNLHSLVSRDQQTITRSQQILAASGGQYQQPIVPIIDLQIAMITPPTIAARTMRARLIKRDQCSDLVLKTYGLGINQWFIGSGLYGHGSSNYANSASAIIPSSSASQLAHNQPSSILLSLFVSFPLLISSTLFQQTLARCFIRHPPST